MQVNNLHEIPNSMYCDIMSAFTDQIHRQASVTSGFVATASRMMRQIVVWFVGKHAKHKGETKSR
jgi:hypothetical protein